MRSVIALFLLFFSTFASFADYIPAVIKIYDESEIDDLIDSGAIIERRRGDILLCYLPDDEEETKSTPDNQNLNKYKTKSGDGDVSKGLPHNKDYQRNKGRIIRPTLDHSVNFFAAREIQEGTAFPTPFTGKGVIVGLCDIGLDPLHPTFLDENGKTRVKRITHYKEYEGERIVLEGDEAYLEWKTDTEENYHATHVAGILAGRGAGSPYVGIATDSDIVASLSSLTDFGLLMGVEDIIDYAKEAGQPVVINLSVGSYIGAHDGTSLFSQYLDMCAEDAVIVLSAGNEGNNTNTLCTYFSEDKPLQFRLGNRDWDQRHMNGITDIWSDSFIPLKVTLCIYDDESHSVVYENPSQVLNNWETVSYEWNPETPIIPGLSLDGYLTLMGGVDPENGRYELALIYEYESTRLIGTGWAKDLVSVKIEGEGGHKVEVFADGSHTRLMGVSGSPSPDATMSISDLACGFNVVSVGMYGNRDSFPITVEGLKEPELKESGYSAFQTVVHSSYGILDDGRVLPLTVAPGIPLMSAVSRYFLATDPPEEIYIDANGVPWFGTGGTSMSAPYVAGYIASWLEALPGLKAQDVIEMIAASNSHDIPEPGNPRNLSGYFNPTVALRYALDKAGIGQIQNPASLLLPSDHIEIFDITGMKVYAGRADGYRSLPKGIYIFKTPYGVYKEYAR